MTTRIKLLIAASGCLLLLASIAVVTPKAVRAAVATIIRDQDNAARHPFSANCTISAVQGTCTPVIAVPPGVEYVIQNVTVESLLTASGSYGIIGRSDVGGQANAFLAGLTVGIQSDPSHFLIRQTFQVTAYADPGTNITFNGTAFTSPATSMGATVSIMGYYVTLP